VPAALTLAPTLANRDDRRRALHGVGSDAPHPAFAPLLLAIASNPSEDKWLRTLVIAALTMTPHESVVPDLIGLLRADEPEVAGTASGYLWRLTGYNAMNEIARERGEGPKSGAELVPRYEKWWEEHKATFNYEFARERLLTGIH
jgi:HEAT repeat protein